MYVQCVLLLNAPFVTLISLLPLQVSYRLKKGSLPGPDYVPPLIGKVFIAFGIFLCPFGCALFTLTSHTFLQFFDSLNPSFDNYLAQWQSGELSCTSVFQIFIVLGNSVDIARRLATL